MRYCFNVQKREVFFGHGYAITAWAGKERESLCWEVYRSGRGKNVLLFSSIKQDANVIKSPERLLPLGFFGIM